MARWVKSWMVESSTRKNKYTVSYGDDGSWGCSCPSWKYHRNECKHIREIIGLFGRHPSVTESPYHKPKYVVLDDIGAPYYDSNTQELRVPHGFPDNREEKEHLEVHICALMLENGYSIREIRSIRSLDDSWTRLYIEGRYNFLGAFDPKGWTPNQNRVINRTQNKKKSNGGVRELMVIG
jgi:hypothetical protein